LKHASSNGLSGKTQYLENCGLDPDRVPTSVCPHEMLRHEIRDMYTTTVPRNRKGSGDTVSVWRPRERVEIRSRRPRVSLIKSFCFKRSNALRGVRPTDIQYYCNIIRTNALLIN